MYPTSKSAYGGGMENPAMKALSEQYRKQTEMDTQAAQNQLTRDEFTRNQATAQNYALTQSHGLQSTEAPRTITDTSMTIGSGGQISGGTVNHSSASGGTTKELPPQLAGRYMNLMEGKGAAAYKAPTDLDTSKTPNVNMPAASFTPGDATGYQNAAFARLKDQAGQLGRSSVDSLSSELAGRGISGASGTFARGVGQRISEAVQPLADLNVAHLGQEYQASQHARELAEQHAQVDYSGQITQRGQSTSQQNALNALKMAISGNQYESDVNEQNYFLEMLKRYMV